MSPDYVSIPYSINDYIIGLFPTATEVEYFGTRVTYMIPTDEARSLSKVFNDLEKGTVSNAFTYFSQKSFISEVILKFLSWSYCFGLFL